MSNKVSIHILQEGIDQHKGLLSNFAKRLAVGGDMETAQKSLDLFNADNREKNDHARNETMELAKVADILESCFKEYEALDASDPEKMEALMKRINDRNGNGSEEKKTRPVQQQIAQILGINSNGGTNLNEEDDLEVTIVQRDDPRSLKCPITRQLFENPVKNKICGHSYDKEAIIQHLRIARNKKCPVAGCNNINIKADQLLENIELTQEVRRYKRRVDLQKERDMTQAIGLDSDEED